LSVFDVAKHHRSSFQEKADTGRDFDPQQPVETRWDVSAKKGTTEGTTNQEKSEVRGTTASPQLWKRVYSVEYHGRSEAPEGT